MLATATPLPWATPLSVTWMGIFASLASRQEYSALSDENAVRLMASTPWVMRFWIAFTSSSAL